MLRSHNLDVPKGDFFAIRVVITVTEESDSGVG